jgi:hypothetical protein
MTPLTAAVLSDIDRIAASQGPYDDDSNTFWHKLGKVHRDKIARYGFETFKRHINFGYGSWQITKFSSRFTLFCLYALIRRGSLPKVARIDWDDIKPMPVWGEAVSDRNNAEQRLRAYAF